MTVGGPFRRVAAPVVGLMRLLGWRRHVTGLQHVPEGGAVITWNHHGHLDMIPVAVAVYEHLDREVRIVAREEFFSWRLLGRALAWIGALPVPSGDGGTVVGPAVRALEAGQLVMVAPEGHISRSFELGWFRTGAVRMAGRAGVPVVPAVSWGTHRLSTAGRRDLRAAWRLPVEIAFGPPLRPGPDDDPRAQTRRLREVMAGLLERVQARYPDGTPPGAWWVPRRLGGSAPPPSH